MTAKFPKSITELGKPEFVFLVMPLGQLSRDGQRPGWMFAKNADVARKRGLVIAFARSWTEEACFIRSQNPRAWW